MTRYLTLAALVLALGLGGFAWHQHRRASDLAADLASARAQLEQREHAAKVHRAHIARLEAERARWAETTRDLQSLEGRDEPLDGALLHGARRLWP